LKEGERTKLRNTLAYWDRDSGTIWLRARGFNFLTAPHMVAKFNIAASDDKIRDVEIRFSSGLPLIFALFLLSAYLMFSASMAANPGAPSPALFGGVVAVIFVIGGFVNRRRLISRMEQLTRDALAELGESNTAAGKQA
jgi:hypothetical protein